MLKSAIGSAVAFCLVVSQAAVPLGISVAGPQFEGIIISTAQYERRNAVLAWPASASDVHEAESRLAAFIASPENEPVLRGSRISVELANYKRQYWGVVRDGHRELLITFIHRASPLVESGQWRTSAILLEGGAYPSTTGVVVQGGGERHFRVSYSVEAKRFSRLIVNAPI